MLAKITFVNTETSHSQAASPGSVMYPVLAINMADPQNFITMRPVSILLWKWAGRKSFPETHTRLVRKIFLRSY